MSAITPSTNLRLLKNPNNLTHQNQLTFANLTTQFNYFNSLESLSVTDFTYQRKDYTIRFKGCIDDLLEYNYVMYQNEAYSNKWFYANIENMRYLNDNATEITIKTDVYQTYMFDVTYKASFVEREHVNDDTVGLHTYPEGLETGDYVCSSRMSLFSGGNTTYICVASTNTPITIGTNPYIRQYNGVYSGLYYTIFETPYNASKFIHALDANGQGDAVASVFLVPTALCGTITFTHYSPEIPAGSGTHIEFDAGVLAYGTAPVTLSTVTSITSPTSLNGYTPKNKKLFCYPYNYMLVTNNVGTDTIFHYEDFVNNTASFETIGAVTPGCSIKCIPLNYKKLQDTTVSAISTLNSYDYGISGPKYPICSWVNDVYTNWLTQNGVNVFGHFFNAAEAGKHLGHAQAFLGLGGLIAGDVNALDTTIEGMQKIFEANQERMRHERMPDTVGGNINSGDITFSSGNMDIPLYKMTVRQEYAKIIDQFFSMYGYQVNTVKVPNITGRTYWNYVKTIGANIEAELPDYFLNELKAMFNNGVTFWHDPTKFLDYTQNNTIVT